MTLRFPILLFKGKQFTQLREEDLPPVDDKDITGQQQVFVDSGFQVSLQQQTLVCST
jgi:hypothetical protein